MTVYRVSNAIHVSMQSVPKVWQSASKIVEQTLESSPSLGKETASAAESAIKSKLKATPLCEYRAHEQAAYSVESGTKILDHNERHDIRCVGELCFLLSLTLLFTINVDAVRSIASQSRLVIH
jgi:hypothetical protein